MGMRIKEAWELMKQRAAVKLPTVSWAIPPFRQGVRGTILRKSPPLRKQKGPTAYHMDSVLIS